MNYLQQKYVIGYLTILIMVAITGCTQKKETTQETQNQSLYEIYWVNEDDIQNEELYEAAILLDYDSSYNVLFQKREQEYPEYAMEIGSALVYQIERYKDEPDRTFHTMFYTIPETTLTEAFVEGVNEKYNLDLNIDEWEGMKEDWETSPDGKYYCKLTAKEITALADSGIICKYIGSGEGDKNAVEFETVGGIYIFCELYGDQYIHYKEGMSNQY